MPSPAHPPRGDRSSRSPRVLLGSFTLLATLACADQTLLMVRVHGETATPPLRAVDDVQRLDLRVHAGGQLAWSGQFTLQDQGRLLDETLALRPGSRVDDALTLRVRGVHDGVEIAEALVDARFTAGEVAEVELALRWTASTCLDLDGDGHGRGPACLGLDCDETSATVHAGAAEDCNGLDDDCDGETDEAADLARQPCERTLGVCRGARAVCGGSAGWLACPDSTYGAAFEPSEQTCDGFDNDCDGTADPGCACQPGQSRSCEGFDVGACDPGEQQCQAVGSSWIWRAQCVNVVEPGDEQCNGLDDDCDGATDEDFDVTSDPLHCSGCGLACVLEHAEAACVDARCAIAACETGHHDLDADPDNGCEYACVRGGAPGEQCNGLDDDCNGVVDDVARPPACALTRGVCNGVQPICIAGDGRARWAACDYGLHYEPVETRCDGMDNDCDGETDEGVECPSCLTTGDCEDGNTCTEDRCEAGRCRFVARDQGSGCDDGQFCTTDDRCDGAARCVGLGPAPCTAICRARCDETSDSCQPDLLGTPCPDDGVYCNGRERCDGQGACAGPGDPCPTQDCLACDEARRRCLSPPGDPCTDDGLYCTGAESCDGLGHCVSSGDPCPGTPCNTCQEDLDSCHDPLTSGCDDGAFCTDGDHCDSAGACSPGLGSPCSVECQTVCAEESDSCGFDLPDAPCTDDDVFCNGAETCDGAGHCLPAGTSPCPETTCRHCQEDDDSCVDPSPTPCEDGNACTYGDTCDGSGTCTPGTFDNNVDGDLHINAACGGDDCDDHDPSVPAPEGPICDPTNTCRDGKDNDCDTQIDAADGDCAGTGYLCLYADPASYAPGPPGTVLRAYLGVTAPDLSRLRCFTDGARALPEAVLGQADFATGLGMLSTTEPSLVYVDAEAQNPSSAGSAGLMVCGNGVALSQTFDTQGRGELVLRYAVRPHLLADGEHILVEYSPNGGVSWYLLHMFGDATFSLYRPYAHVLPPDAEGVPELRVRFRGVNPSATHCAYLDDVVLAELPAPTERWPLHQASFEQAQGFPASGACGSSLGSYTATTGTTYACMASVAQNPATQDPGNTQGLRALYNASVSGPLFETRFLPAGAELRLELALRGYGLDADEYCQAFLGDETGLQRRIASVGMGAPWRWESVRALVAREFVGAGRGRVVLTAPTSAGLSTVEGLYADDVEVVWQRASLDQVGTFADPGDGSYIAVLQSAQAGTASVTCVYLGSSPPLVTDGSGLSSAPLTMTITP